MKKIKRGGVRENSGRKEIGENKKEPITYYLEKWKIAKIGGRDAVRKQTILSIEKHLSSLVKE